MATQMLDPVLFIDDGEWSPLLASKDYPFLLNRNGHGVQLQRPEGDLIAIAPDDPDLDLGSKYHNITHAPKEIAGEPPYWITEFNFRTSEVAYQPLRATRQTARAFGMTLLKSGECVRFPFDGLITAQYTYGKWAGHQSPYLQPSRRRELLTKNATDLEFHNFAHVFFSQDTVPLVISVARWRPYVAEIALADLWISPGDAIVLPPKHMPDPPRSGATYAEARRLIADMHGNRNSALACWTDDRRPSLRTTTILANDEVMSAPATKPHYHEETTATHHQPPQAGE